MMTRASSNRDIQQMCAKPASLNQRKSVQLTLAFLLGLWNEAQWKNWDSRTAKHGQCHHWKLN